MRIFLPLLIVLLFHSMVTDAPEKPVVKCEGSFNRTIGSDVILPCSFKSLLNQKNVMVEWRRNTTLVHRHGSGWHDDKVQDEKYKGRTSMFENEVDKGNVSLRLTKVTVNDTGNYTCKVKVSDDQVKEYCVHLYVEKPVVECEKRVNATVGKNVTLPCYVEPPYNMTPIAITWEINGTIVHGYKSQGNHTVGQNEEYENKTSIWKSDVVKGNISLRLTNVTEKHAGNYTCWVKVSKLHPDIMCYTNLSFGPYTGGIYDPHITVTPTPPARKIDPGLIAGVVGGIVIIVIIVLIVKYRRKLTEWICRGRSQREPSSVHSANSQGERGEAVPLSSVEACS